MHTVFALLCFVMVIHWLIFPYPSGLLHWHCGNLTIAPVPAKQPWWIWINTSCEFIMNDCITTTKQSTTKPCAYFLGYTVCVYRLVPNPNKTKQIRTVCIISHMSCGRGIPRTLTGPWFNIKMSSYQYRKSHCGDKTVVRSSYLHNEISYTGKMTSLYWIGAQMSIYIILSQSSLHMIDPHGSPKNYCDSSSSDFHLSTNHLGYPPILASTKVAHYISLTSNAINDGFTICYWLSLNHYFLYIEHYRYLLETLDFGFGFTTTALKWFVQCIASSTVTS